MKNPNTDLRLVEAVLHFQGATEMGEPVPARLSPSYLYTGVTLTALHERPTEAEAHDIYTVEGFAAFMLADGESLTLLARFEGAIIAAGVFEVAQAASDIGLLLVPRGSANLLLHQVAVDRFRLAAIDVANTSRLAEQDEDEEEDGGYARC